MNDIVMWLTYNADMISSAALLIMAMVWVFYAQLLYRDFTRRHHPRIMIHQAPDTGIDAVCLVINIGQQIVNIAPIIAVGITRDGDKRLVEITDYRNVGNERLPDGEMELTRLLKQGPIGPGGYIRLGSFKDIAATLSGQSKTGGAGAEAIGNFERIEIRVALFSGDGAGPAGAWRSFDIDEQDGVVSVRPHSPQTHQMISNRQRRQVKRWLDVLFA